MSHVLSEITLYEPSKRNGNWKGPELRKMWAHPRNRKKGVEWLTIPVFLAKTK